MIENLPSPIERVMVQSFSEKHPEEVARLCEGLATGTAARVLEHASVESATKVFERLSPQLSGGILQKLSDRRVKEIFETLDPAETARVLLRLDETVRYKYLDDLKSELSEEIRELMSFPTDSAGNVMDTRITAFRSDGTVSEFWSRLREQDEKPGQNVFLVDGRGHLVGKVLIQELSLADKDKALEEIAEGAPISVRSMASREEVVEIMDRYKPATLPVVDIQGKLLGGIRLDALVREVEKQATADMQTMVGASKEERALSSIPFAVRKRLPWLQINLATAFLAASVVGLFEDTIAKFTALAVLLPVVAGQSGNTGAQALAVTMRGLSLREVRRRHWPRVLLKEAGVGSLNGVAVAVVTSVGVFLWSQSAGLALVIGVAMVVSMAIAGIAGAGIPVVLSALGQDPAQSSSIILTTVTDVAGFFSFLGLATLLAGML